MISFRHGDYHQAMGFVVSFLMLFLDDEDILKIVCVCPFCHVTTATFPPPVFPAIFLLGYMTFFSQIHPQRRAQVNPSALQPKPRIKSHPISQTNALFSRADITPVTGKPPLLLSNAMLKCKTITHSSFMMSPPPPPPTITPPPSPLQLLAAS